MSSKCCNWTLLKSRRSRLLGVGSGGAERRDGSRCGGYVWLDLYAFNIFTVKLKASWGGAGAVSGAR